MWFWGKKKELHTTDFKNAVVQSFMNISEDIKSQKQWISYLNNIYRLLAGSHDQHKTLTKKDLETIKAWIVHLDNTSKKHSEQVKLLENNLRQTFAAYNQYFAELNKQLSASQVKEDQIKKLISQEISEYARITRDAIIQNQSEAEAKHDELHGKIMKLEDDVQSVESRRKDMHSALLEKIDGGIDDKQAALDKKHKEIEQKIRQKHEEFSQQLEEKYNKIRDIKKDIESQYLLTKEDIDKIKEEIHGKGKETLTKPSGLTNPEQKLLNLLLAQPDPVSYAIIAEKTGNSINTVRVIMNSLKKYGLIEENTLPSGVKLFNAINKEKIKKLYNIEHI